MVIQVPPKSTVIYNSLHQVWKTLTINQKLPEVRSIINLCYEVGLLEGSPSKGDIKIVPKSCRSDAAYPFVVIEGLDGTGKTTLTRYLSSRLNMKLMSTPPKNYEALIRVRDAFDGQPEFVRRAYYSLGNYLAAYDVTTSERPVVMDRFWHSTAAYALAHQMKHEGPCQLSDLTWPTDLLQPDLVIFLQVSEKERLRRHATRKEFTNTNEEQTLAEDEKFRKNLVECYRSVRGPPMTEIIINGQQTESEAKILEAVLSAFPTLKERVKVSLR